MKNTGLSHWIHQTLRVALALGLTLSMVGVMAQGAQARVIFQDDTFHDIVSEGVIINSDDGGDEDVTFQLGNDGTDASIFFDDGTGDLTITTPGGDVDFGDENLSTTGGLSADGQVDFSAATGIRIREVADEAAALCTTANELVVDTTENRLYICTTPGAPGTWTPAASQDFEDVYAADADDTLTATGTFDIDATGAVGIDSDAGVTVGGAGVSVTSDGGALSLTGDGTNDIDVLNTGGGIDFDSATFTLDTTAGVSIDAGAASNVTTSAGDLTLEATTGSTNLTGGEAAVDAVRLNASNAAGGIDADAGTGGIALDTTGSFSADAATSSNLTVTGNSAGAETLTLNATNAGAGTGDIDVTADDSIDVTTTNGDVTITGGDDVIFDDAQLTAPIQLTNTDTGFDATFSGETGIVDVINTFTSTANGEGASNIGIEDAGGYFTGTDAEAALQELGASADNNNDVLTFYPEYPDTVVSQDGTNNKGKLVTEYDSTGDRNYYEWTSKTGSLQDIDLRFRFELPTDWVSTNDFTIDYQTGTANVAENAFDVTLVNITDTSTTCASSASNVNTAWTTVTLAQATIQAGCTGGTALDAGDIVEVQIKLYADNTNGAYARSGQITWAYTN